MSAQPCGCDDAEGWVCEQHRVIVGGVNVGHIDRFKARLAAETQPTPAEQFRSAAVAVVHAVQTRDDLLNRITILEAEVAQLQRRNGQRQHDYLYLLEMERHDKEQFRDRIAAITATFYHADLTISSVQPILALACELNPELVERAR